MFVGTYILKGDVQLMLFSSIPYLYFFFPVALLFYFAAPKKLKNTVLLILSLIFYFYGEEAYVLLLLFSSATGYIVGLIVEKYRGSIKAKAALYSAIIINLLILGFFKYTDFFIENINALLGTNIALMRISLPLGISFFVFQTISYVVDVWRESAPAEKNPLDFTMYVSMFPQLVAGPIVRYNTVAAEIRERKHSFENFSSGVSRFVTGLAKKVLIANELGALSGLMLATSEPTVLSQWLAIFAYILQIYFDFSGYSDMAIGLGKMIGFNFPENFNYPFIADSISDFWRRWHISMGTWFREYLYIPLGGNRVSKIKWIRNIFIVWFCTGLWHGASWNFIFWGLYFGVLLALEKLLWGKAVAGLPKWIRHIYTLGLVFFSFIIFYIESVPEMFTHLAGMFGAGGLPVVNTESIYYLKSYAPLLIVACIGSTPIVKNIAYKIRDAQKIKLIVSVLEPALYILLLIAATGYIVDSSFNPFLYFRF